jgi:hypothetical protein
MSERETEEERAVGVVILTYILRNLKWSGERQWGKKSPIVPLRKIGTRK